MNYLVAYDGQELSVAALERARQYAAAMDATVLAVTVVPNDRDYALDRGWIDDEDEFGLDLVTTNLREEVHSVAPDADLRFVQASGNASPGMIASKVRSVARETDPEVVFVGSDNAGGLVTPISSVGGTLSGMEGYDVFIVRHPVSD